MSDTNSSLPIRTEAAGDVAVKIVDSAVTSQQLKVNADGSTDVNLLTSDVDIRDLSASQDNVAISDGTNTLAINADGSINVKIADGTPGTAVNDFDTASSLAGGGTSNHTYTAVGNFTMQQVLASASGKAKVEIQVNGSTVCVLFNSTANPNMNMNSQSPPMITAGQTITVIRTNRENQPQDVYSTIIGYES